MDRIRMRGWMVVLLALALLLPLVGQPAHAHEQPWVSESEAGVNSADAVEPDILPIGSPNPNLCEGTVGLPFGADPSWVRVNGSPDPATPFVEARGQLLPELSSGDATNPFVSHIDLPLAHYTKDINAFITLDRSYRHLLATPGNFHEGGEDEHSVLEV